MTRLRRALTIPLVILLVVCVLVSSPLTLAVSALVGFASGSSRPIRTVTLAMAYAVIELRTLVRVARGERDCDRLMRNFVASAHAAVQRILEVDVVVDSGSPTPKQIPRDEPVIVLARHCGPGDTVLVSWLLVVEYGLRLRVVLKAALRCEPVLDLAGDLNALCFLSNQSGRARTQIENFSASLTGGQALLLFPEGGNFSWPRWRTAITRLRSIGRAGEADRAWHRSHTLPPRTGGAAAALAGAPSANVVVLAHNGFRPDGRARRWWRLPVQRRLLVHMMLIPSAQRPHPDQLAPWLERTWAQVDAWVAENSGARINSSQAR